MELSSAAQNFGSTLRSCATLELKYEKRLEPKDWVRPYGKYIRVAHTDNHVWISIAKGKYFADAPESFWVGFESQDPKKDQKIISVLVESVKTKINVFRMAVDQQRWPAGAAPDTIIDGSYFVAERYFDAKYASRSIAEYPCFIFGIYFAPNVDFKFEVGRNFVRDVLEANGFDLKTNDDESKMLGFEGEMRRLFTIHRKREAALRNAKIEQALEQNKGRLPCEVPACGFDFVERYGEIGKGFAHVHHKSQLGLAPAKGHKVSLTDLAVVCPNCHAMIHIGGQCRAIETLVPMR